MTKLRAKDMADAIVSGLELYVPPRAGEDTSWRPKIAASIAYGVVQCLAAASGESGAYDVEVRDGQATYSGWVSIEPDLTGLP